MDEITIPRRVAEGDFSGWLGDVLTRRRITQRELAEGAGLDHSAISRLVQGHHSPTLATAIAILQALSPVARPQARQGIAINRRGRAPGRYAHRRAHSQRVFVRSGTAGPQASRDAAISVDVGGHERIGLAIDRATGPSSPPRARSRVD